MSLNIYIYGELLFKNIKLVMSVLVLVSVLGNYTKYLAGRISIVLKSPNRTRLPSWDGIGRCQTTESGLRLYIDDDDDIFTDFSLYYV